MQNNTNDICFLILIGMLSKSKGQVLRIAAVGYACAVSCGYPKRYSCQDK